MISLSSLNQPHTIRDISKHEKDIFLRNALKRFARDYQSAIFPKAVIKGSVHWDRETIAGQRSSMLIWPEICGKTTESHRYC